MKPLVISEELVKRLGDKVHSEVRRYLVSHINEPFSEQYLLTFIPKRQESRLRQFYRLLKPEERYRVLLYNDLTTPAILRFIGHQNILTQALYQKNNFYIIREVCRKIKDQARLKNYYENSINLSNKLTVLNFINDENFLFCEIMKAPETLHSLYAVSRITSPKILEGLVALCPGAQVRQEASRTLEKLASEGSVTVTDSDSGQDSR
jgi:hypothetical protein